LRLRRDPLDAKLDAITAPEWSNNPRIAFLRTRNSSGHPGATSGGGARRRRP